MVVIDDFEDGDLNEYNDTGDFDATTTRSVSGSYAIEQTSSNYNTAYKTSSAFSKGDVASFYHYTGNGSIRFCFGLKDGNNCYMANLEPGGLQLEKRDGSDNDKASSGTSYSGWYYVEVDWQNDDDIVVTTYNASSDGSIGSSVETLSFNDSEYANETGIGFRVGSGGSSWIDYIASPPADASVSPPSSPNNTSFTVTGDDDLDVTWSEPSDWGNEVGDYDLQVSEDGGSYTQIASPTTELYSYAAPTAVNTFRFRVRASNSAGVSGWDYSTTKSTDPSGLSVTGSTDTSTALSWTGVDDSNTYEIQRGQASGSLTTLTTTTGTTFDDTGLESGEKYYYTVRAVYSGTDSTASNEVAATTTLPAPTVTLDASTEDQITVDWTLNDNSSDGNVELYRSTDGSVGSLVNTFSLSTTSLTDTGLKDGERYYYTIRRVTDHVSAETQQDDVTVLPAPTALTVSSVTANSAELNWTDNHNNGETQVQYKPTSTGSWVTLSTLSIGTNAETLTGLRNGEAYDARILASTEHTQTEDT